jgi:hypothetical protein
VAAHGGPVQRRPPVLRCVRSAPQRRRQSGRT